MDKSWWHFGMEEVGLTRFSQLCGSVHLCLSAPPEMFAGAVSALPMAVPRLGGSIPRIWSGPARTIHVLPRGILEWVKYLIDLNRLLAGWQRVCAQRGLLEGSTTGQGLHCGTWGVQAEFLVALSDPSDTSPPPVSPLPRLFPPSVLSISLRTLLDPPGSLRKVCRMRHIRLDFSRPLPNVRGVLQRGHFFFYLFHKVTDPKIFL